MAEEERAIEDRVADIFDGPEEPAEDLDSNPSESASEAPQDEIDEKQGVEAAEDESPVEDASDAPEPEYVEIELDGKLYEFPKDVEPYVMRHKDYTQKTQDLAAQRKEAEVHIGQIEEQRRALEFLNSVQDEQQQIQLLDHQINQYREYMRANIDSIGSTDLEKIRFHIEELNLERNKQQESMQKKEQEFQQAREQSVKELLDKSTEVLRSKIPDWNDTTQQRVRDFATSSGFTEDEVANVTDPRYVEVLYKAMQYDNIKSEAKTIKQKAQSAPTIKPKSRNPMPAETKRKLNLRKKLKSDNLDAKEKAAHIQDEMAARLGL